MFGPTFADELNAAGIGGIPITWGEDGVIEGRENLTPEQNALLDTVIAAHDAAVVDLSAYLASVRWQFETGGLDVSGVRVATDRESQALINGAFNLVQAMPDQIIKFKSAAGWVELDATAMTAISIAVGQHVQAAFALEASIADEITAGTITTTEEIDAAFAAA